MDDREERPVLTGLLALVGVAVVVGLVLGFAALLGTRVLGLDGGSDSSNSSAERSMYLPKPSRTTAASGPLITLAPGEESSSSAPPKEPKKSRSPEKKISLSAGETAVGPMEQIDLTGVYPGGEGAILQVQRFTNGAWTDFPVTASVSNETFSTYVQTSQTGVNRFRVVDTDTKLQSNEVKVTIG
ncbi:hypothetical protein ACT8ZV_08315 [Nocardioides sp. MAHUQ-72]|uniref:hypothetical protein n=1 Tax=unclassified Nocardioides TaxID=2615069 RepID=UPI0036060303